MTLLSGRRTLPICSPLGLAAISACLLIVAVVNQGKPVTHHDPWIWKASGTPKAAQQHGRTPKKDVQLAANLPKAANITDRGDEESSSVKRQAFEPVTTTQARRAEKEKLEVLQERGKKLAALGRPVYPDLEEHSSHSAVRDEEILKNRQKVMDNVYKLIHPPDDQLEQDSRYSHHHAPSGKIINTRPLKEQGLRLPLRPSTTYGVPAEQSLRPKPQFFNGPTNSSPRPNLSVGEHLQSYLQTLHKQGGTNQGAYTVPVYTPGSRPPPVSASSVNFNIGHHQQEHRPPHGHQQQVQQGSQNGQYPVQGPLDFLQGYHGNGQQASSEPLMFLAEIQHSDQPRHPFAHFGQRPYNDGGCHCQKKLANGNLPSVDEAGFRPYYGELQPLYGTPAAEHPTQYAQNNQHHLLGNGVQQTIGKHGQRKGLTIPVLIKIFPHVVPIEAKDHEGQHFEVHHHHPPNVQVHAALDHHHGHRDDHHQYIGPRVGRDTKTGEAGVKNEQANAGENKFVSPTAAGNELASRIIQQTEQQQQRSGSDINDADGNQLKTTIVSNSPVDT